MNVVGLTRAYSFDCYGTLIDWESGIRGALAQVAALAEVDLADASAAGFVARREAIELRVEGEQYRPYDEMLALSLTRCATEFGLVVGESDGKRFAASLADWEPFADAPPFLRRLRADGLPLAILSNVTRAGLRGSVRKLGAAFDLLVTAEDVRSYKPAPQHWLEAQAAFGIGPREQLHIAASLTHDVIPAGRLGVPCVWVNRRDEDLPSGVAPVMVVRDLDELGERLGLGG
jgi:putative hydrolase of the HAD superfamily